MIEKALLANCLRSRSSYELVKRHMDVKSLPRELQLMFSYIADYYKRDESAAYVMPDVLAAQIQATLPNPKHRALYTDMLAQLASIEVSESNINEVIVGAKIRELSSKIAVSLANRDGKDAALIEEYTALKSATSMDQLKDGKDIVVIDSSSIAQLIDDVITNEGAFKLYPSALNNVLGGRLNSGHHVTLFAPPEVGKTALACTFAGGFCRQGRRGLYLLNEDRNKDAYFRLISTITGLSFEEIEKAPHAAIEQAKAMGIDNVTLVGMNPGNISLIDSLVSDYDAEWFVVDQMINLAEKGDGLSQILGKAARGIRTIAKTRDALGISVCQGGDSSSGKAVLEMGDVYMSNTEVPAMCDVLIGIGANRDMLMRDERMACVIKNKVTGWHGEVPLNIVRGISRYVSVG